jgi:hypothetical protein
MQRSLGKMTVHQLFDWRNRASDSIQQTVAEFLELVRRHRNAMDPNCERPDALADGS